MKNKIKQRIEWLKDNAKLIFLLLITLVMLLLSCSESGAAHSLAMATVITGAAGGKHIVGGPLTTDITREASPELLLNEIDSQVAKIRPMATPIDQISRCAGAKHAGSMIVDYYSVDTKDTHTVLNEDYDEPEEVSSRENNPAVNIVTAHDAIFDTGDTILVQGIYGYKEGGEEIDKQTLVLYVVSRDDINGLYVSAVNGKKIGTATCCVPSIPAGTTLIRMGRAATELDVMTAQFESLPVKEQQFCQIFKCQVEMSTLQKLSNKEVPWNMSDVEEAAIYDMKLGMEKSFLFGVKSKIWDNTKKEHVMLTGGIWKQAAKQYNYDNQFNDDKLVDLMREAFTGNAGSKRKILIGGSGLISALNKLNYTKVVTAGESVVKWGIDFDLLKSKFGTLYVLLSEVFDDCGMADNGIIIDPEYIQKYSHIPFGGEALDLKASGVRNVDALVLTEASCLVLRYPQAHMRIVKS